MATICYLDEAGCLGMLPSSTSEIQPIFILCGLIIDAENIQPLTTEFVDLKRKFFPGNFASIKHDLDALPIEIKGSDLRKNMKHKHKGKREHTYRFLDDVIALINKYNGKLTARICIKNAGAPFDGRAVYTTSTQRIAHAFEHYLHYNGRRGVIIADFREPKANSHISHSVFTQKYRKKRSGDPFPSILEVPSFGISNNHACLQITDLLASAILYPMASYTYCTGYVKNVHVDAKDAFILKRYNRRIKNLQYNYKKGCGNNVFGVSVTDPYEHRSSLKLFE